jgi:hypothetical protein
MGLLLATRGPQHGIGTMLIPYSETDHDSYCVFYIFNYTWHICIVEKASVSAYEIYGLCKRGYKNKKINEIFSLNVKKCQSLEQ